MTVTRIIGVGLLLQLLVFCLHAAGKDASLALSPINQIKQIRQMSREAANAHPPVDIQGMVTYWDPATLDLYVQDEFDGIYVTALSPDLTLSVGNWVRIQGLVSGENSTPTIIHPVIQFAEKKAALIQPRKSTVEQFRTGSDDARWVALEGIVQQASDSGGRLLLWIRSGGQKIQAAVLHYPGSMNPAEILHDRIRIRGVCQTIMHGEGQVDAVRLLANSLYDDFEILRDSNTGSNPAVVEYKVADLERFKSTALPDEVIRLSGLAEASQSDGMTLRDATGAIRVYSSNPVFKDRNLPTQADGFLECDPDGKLVLANARVTQIAGCCPQSNQYDVNWRPSPPDPTHQVITEIDALRKISSDEAFLGYPVHFEGTVTWLDRRDKIFTIQSGNSGLFIDMESGFPEGFDIGRLVEVSGYCGRGSFAPFVFKTKARVIGESGIPLPWTGNPSDLYMGRQDGRWIELEGVVRSLPVRQTNEIILSVATADVKYNVCFPTNANISRMPGVDAKVRVRGVCNILAREMQALDFNVLVSDVSQVQEFRAPIPKDKIPLGGIRQLYSSLSEMSSGHRVRLRGTVTLSERRDMLYIADEAHGLRIFPNTNPQFQCGDFIEATGFPAMNEARVVVLEDADVVLLKRGQPLQPVLCQFSKEIDPALDGRLVKAEQLRLVEKHQRNGAIELIMEAQGRFVFDAQLPDNRENRDATALEIGSRMDLTGIYVVRMDLSRKPRALAILMRDARDIGNVTLPPMMWTPRFLKIFALCAAALGASMLWTLLLRRRVAQQTGIIQQQLERKAALERRYGQLIENASDLIFTTDGEGRFTSVNPACERVTGYSRAEALQMDIFAWTPAEMQPRIRERLSAQTGSGISNPYEVDMVAKSGRRMTLELSTRVLYEREKIAGMEGIARDITERRLLEEQLHQARKMESVGQLAAGVAHDFNNIMTIILGHGDLLTQEELRPEARESCIQVLNAANRAAELTRQLLAFSRKQFLQPRLLDINELITNLGKMLSRLLGEHIAFVFHLEEGQGLPAIKGDRGMLEQVLLNLCVNARDAMPGGGTLVVSTQFAVLTSADTETHPDARTGAFVRLSVEDTGCGMDKATLDRIFEPFFTTKEVGKGTGLGLASVYGIVKQHEGWVTVSSKPGLGTRFDIFLPASPASQTAAEAHSSAIESKGGGELILVVEDEASLRNLADRVLRQNGYRVIAAGSGRAALELWGRQTPKPDLLMTDLVMPEGVSGQELAQCLREAKPDLKVLFTSGYSGEFMVQNLNLDRNSFFLPKPYLPSKLTQTIKKCLAGTG